MQTTVVIVICRCFLDVAEEVFKRCAVSNEDEVGKDDPNYTITFNYEFLEDFTDDRKGGNILTRTFTR